MNITWFSWKDIGHPKAGGAETVSWQVMRRLVRDGHNVKLVTARYKGSDTSSLVEGVEILRTGNGFTVYFKVFLLFRRRLAKWSDLNIDEMNTIPFFVGYYSRKKRILLTYQLARQVWLYQMRPPLSWIGYAVEPLYLLLLSLRYKTVLTESQSTRSDLARFGFAQTNTHVFRIGTGLRPAKQLEPKRNMKHLLILGAMRAMKQTLDAVMAFEQARDASPSLYLTIAGDNSGKYAQTVLDYIAGSRHKDAIHVVGKVSDEVRIGLMREAALILVTSIKEGWGLIVTEANSQGTPAIAYDCDGIRDSVVDCQTGLLVNSGDYKALSRSITEILSNQSRYDSLRNTAWSNSKQYTFENSYSDFIKAGSIEKLTT